MKKLKIIIIIGIIAILGVGIGYMYAPKRINKQPEISQVRAICNLATLKTYYHNVAKIEKGKDWIFQRDRELWIEYTGIVTIGIDMSMVEMKVEGNKVIVSLPKAKLLSIDIDEEKINEDSYFYSKDNLVFKNQITAEEQTQAINEAQTNMKSSVEENSQLLKMAQERSKALIEQYITQLGELSKTNYNIEWQYEE